MPKLTQKFITNEITAPESGQVIYRDTLLRGFGLRVTPGCKSFIVEGRANGVFRRITLGKHGALTPTAARKKARRVLAMLVLGHDPVLEKAMLKAKAVTLEEVLNRYLAVRDLRQNTKRLYRNVMTQRLGDWLTLPVTSISCTMVEIRHREISTVSGVWKASRSQANMTMYVLKLLLNFAAGHYQVNGQPILSSNPVRTLSQNKSWHRIPARQSIIPDHKLSTWYRAIASLGSTTVRDLLLLVLFTGLRHREATTLRFDDIDFDSRTLRVRPEMSKNHKEHRLPLSSFVFDLLRKRHSMSKSEYVFPGRHGPIVQICQSLKVAKKKSGCQFTVHDLRRVFLTTAEKLGIPYAVLKKLANHAGGNDTTLGYIIVDVERMRAPVELIANRFLTLMDCPNEHACLAEKESTTTI